MLRSQLPININDLIHQRTIEGSRIEFKSAWDDFTKDSTIRTIGAFANDYHNLNGGYIVIGIAADEMGRATLPPTGLDDVNVDELQKQIIELCKKSISPEYIPLLFVEEIQEKTILVIWVPAGDNRPYQCSKRDKSGRAYFIRAGSVSVEAKGDDLRRLMELAQKIPFDDRRALHGKIDDISASLVRKHLSDVRSYLVGNDNIDAQDLYRKLRLTVKVNNHEEPRNIALLFFNDSPENYFPCAYIEVVQFGDDAGGDLIEEQTFRGPLPQQIKSCLSYLEGLGGRLLEKIPGRAEVDRTVPYPYEAMEEAIVNAIYHRGYDYPSEPTKIYLYPDRMEITSYPGPVPGINQEHLQPNAHIPPVPARNRRIGELLKELRLAEMRGTGIPKIFRRMEENGSPQAVFDFDEGRSYFRAILPVHPKYQLLHALREAAQLWATGEKMTAINHLVRTVERQPSSGAIIGQLIEYAFSVDREDIAWKYFNMFNSLSNKSETARPYLTLARILIDKQKPKEAAEILNQLPIQTTHSDLYETAILLKKSGEFDQAHQLFQELFSSDPNRPDLLHDFAQTKIRIASKMGQKRQSTKQQHKHQLQVRKRLTKEAIELLRKAIHLFEDANQKAWCWYELAKALDWLRTPQSEVEVAFMQAMALNPQEPRFRKAFEEWKERKRK